MLDGCGLLLELHSNATPVLHRNTTDHTCGISFLTNDWKIKKTQENCNETYNNY